MEQIKNSKPVAKYSNSLVSREKWQFPKRMTLMQYKFMHYLIINEKNHHNLQGMKWSELVRILEITKGSKYSKKEKTDFFDEISSIKFHVVVDENNMEFRPIFNGAGLRNGRLFYEVNPSVTEVFTTPKKNFYLMNFSEIVKFKKSYSMKIYELLQKELHANQTGPKLLKYDINELKVYLGIEVTSYKKPSDFRRRVLDPSLKEISKHTKIKIEGSGATKQLTSKQHGTDWIYIRGVQRVETTEDYIQGKQNEYDKKVEEGRTKITKGKPKQDLNFMSIEELEKVLAAKRAEQVRIKESDRESLKGYLPKDSKPTEPKQTTNAEHKLTKEKIKNINTKVKTKNDYDGKLLKRLKQSNSTELELTVSELKKILDYPKSYVPSRLNVRIIKPAVKKLQNVAGFEDLKVKDKKEGKVIKSFKFSWNKVAATTIVDFQDFNDETL